MCILASKCERCTPTIFNLTYAKYCDKVANRNSSQAKTTNKGGDMEALELSQIIHQVLIAHAKHSKKPKNAFRKWDGRTPYGVHPIWCAMTFLQETSPALSEDFRWAGAHALLLHDVLEDTEALLPDRTPSEVVELVREMTFASFEVEVRDIWSMSLQTRLLKIYDKVSNLLDGAWMQPEKRQRYIDYVLQLCNNVEPHFGPLNIIKIARAIAV